MSGGMKVETGLEKKKEMQQEKKRKAEITQQGKQAYMKKESD